MTIDWSVFEEVPSDTVYCRCGAVYRSNVKMVRDGESLVIWTQVPCPGCGRDHGHVKRVSGDRETMVLRASQKCSFCPASVFHIGEREIDAGWGKIEVKTGITELVLNHCPKHSKEFAEAIEKWAGRHGISSTRRRRTA